MGQNRRCLGKAITVGCTTCTVNGALENHMPLLHQRTKPRSLIVDSHWKKGKMGGNTESVLKPGIKFRSASGSLRRPQVATHSP